MTSNVPANNYYTQGSRGGPNGSLPYQGAGGGQRYNPRNSQQGGYGSPSMNANAAGLPPAPPTNLYAAGPPQSTSAAASAAAYMMNPNSSANSSPEAGLQSILNSKFFQPNSIAPPPTAPGPNACAFQYQPVSYSPYHAYGQLPYNQPQTVPE